MQKCSLYFVVCFFLQTTWYVDAQSVTIFTLSDFELNEGVKSCLVSTSYGQEDYEFNKNGLLTQSVTRYNEKDYDIVYYKYANGNLLEKRAETYRDNVFDPSTSIAHFYTLDTTESKKVTEKVVSYEKELLEQYRYQYDDKDRLAVIVRSNAEGTDKTVIDHTTVKGEETVTWTMNGEPLKSVRTSKQKKADGTVQKVVLTKEFLKGEGNRAKEEVFGEEGKLRARQDFRFDTEKNSFVPTVRTTFEYNEQGLLMMETAKKGNQVEETKYLYQYDRPEEGNWIKKIITPENTYTTRKITYYPESEISVEKEE